MTATSIDAEALCATLSELNPFAANRTFTIKPVCATLIAHEFGSDMHIEGGKVERLSVGRAGKRH